MPDLSPTELAHEAVVSSAAAEVTVATGAKPATASCDPVFRPRP
ncbi:MAG: hypothetical protein U5K37_09625 [Natrialbaceae archaeon]|nr:hypothetical protein [Natrialbaceae archaeon]